MAGNDTINLSRGRDTVDGGAGSDVLLLDEGSLKALALGASPYRFTLTSGRLSDATGSVDTSFADIETISIIDHSGADISFDATNFSGPMVRLLLGSGNHTVQGPSERGLIIVGSGTSTISAGNAYTQVSVNVDDPSQPVTVGTDGNAIVVRQGTNVTSIRSSLFVGVGAQSDTGHGISIDVETSAVRTLAFIIAGTPYTDRIVGGQETDAILIRGSANDQDSYTGGFGYDQFIIADLSEIGVNGRITDLTSDDAIDFRNAGQAGGFTPQFIGAAAFTGKVGEYRYVASGGQTVIQADVNGDGIADQSLRIASGAFDFFEREPNRLNASARATEIAGTEGSDILNGTDGPDRIIALSGADTIFGNGGDDRIDGGAGADRMMGGDGHDVFYVDTARNPADPDSRGDEVFGDFGYDVAVTSVSYELVGEAVEELRAAEGTAPINLYGRPGVRIVGNAGDNILSVSSRSSATLEGGDGNDTFVVQSPVTMLIEADREGYDIAIVPNAFADFISYTLTENA